jgi:hypothetical protein
MISHLFKLLVTLIVVFMFRLHVHDSSFLQYLVVTLIWIQLIVAQ